MIELNYSNGIYTELNSDFKYEFDLSSEPFIHKAQQITDCIIY